MDSVKGGRLVCRLLHGFLLLLHGFLSLGPVASSEGCFPKSSTPPADAQGAPPTFEFVPPLSLPATRPAQGMEQGFRSGLEQKV